MPLPVAHGLVGASIVALWRPQSSLSRDWKMLLVGAALAISPDFDFFLVWGLHNRSWHRGFTHSIVMGIIVTALLLTALGMPRIKEAVAYGTAFLSHGLLDFVTTKSGGGVELLWPFSRERLKLGSVGVSEFAFGFHLPEVIRYSLIEFTIFAPVLLAVLLLSKYMFARFRST